MFEVDIGSTHGTMSETDIDGSHGTMPTSNTSTAASRGRGRKNAPRNRTDLGWKHEADVQGNGKKVKCNYCSKIVSGGIFRFKHPLARSRKDSEPCTMVLEEVKHLIMRIVAEAKETSK